MIKIVQLSIVNSADIDNTSRHVSKVFVVWLSALDGHAMQMGQQTASKKIVFVSATRMGHDKFDGHVVDRVGSSDDATEE